MKKSDIALLEALTMEFGPSGFEDSVRDWIRSEIEPYVDSITVDPMGNLIATKGNTANVAISAHMDEVGLMITGIEANGKLLFSPIGGISPEVLPAKQVRFVNPEIYGVIGSKPIHLKQNKEEKLSFSDLYIDIGTDSKEESEKLIHIGDPAVFVTEFHIQKNTMTLSAKALDNRLGCFLLIHAIQNDLISNAVFLFTVQEETGLRGAKSWIDSHAVEYGIALDTTTANDLPGIPPHKRIASIGKGGVISFADGATVYRRDYIRKIFNRLAEKKIPAQTKTRRTGGNEASAFEKNGIGATAISLSVPCRYIHGPVGIAFIRDIERTEEALIEIIRLIEEETNE